ncbi:STAS domain-containing protein [Actinosynnema sp. NPDC020468]|uniref:STAS domain-containing protein n=1 Tax=Actinosynnema sp. NPDC020468 TaxID=3154488 RepID=UPI00340E4CE5
MVSTPESKPWARVETAAEGRVVHVLVGGDIDQDSLSVLEGALDEGLAKTDDTAALVAVDLNAVDFLGSVGLSALIRAHGEAVERGRSLAVVLAPEHKVARVLWATALTRIVTVVDSVDQAVTDEPEKA